MPDPTNPDVPVMRPVSRFGPVTLGLILAAAGAALFASKGIFVKLALAEGLDPITILAWRMIIAVPVFVSVGLFSLLRRSGPLAGRRLPLRQVLVAAGVGVLGYWGASYLDFAGLELISAQLNRLILLTYPFFVLILAALFFGRRPPLGAIVAALVAYGGIAVIFAHDFVLEGEDVVLGSVLVIGAAICYALYQLLAKPVIDAIGARLFTSIAMSAAGVMVIGHFLVVHPISMLALTPYLLAVIAGLAVLATVLPAYAIAAAIGHIGPERTAIFGNISPLVTSVLAVVVLGEPFTVLHGVGTALVICGILLFTHLTRHKG